MRTSDLTADLSKPLMPKATAMWLIENTTLTFAQIAAFCGLHDIEVDVLANAESGRGITPRNPIDNNELTLQEIERCQQDPMAKLQMVRPDIPLPKIRAKGPRYTPVARRSDKPDAIAWLIKHHPELSDTAVSKLVGSTKTTVQSVRDRTHPNTANLRPRNPAEIGLCTYSELERLSHKALRAMGKDPVAEDAARKQKMIDEAAGPETSAPEPSAKSFDFSNFFKSNTPATGTNE